MNTAPEGAVSSWVKWWRKRDMDPRLVLQFDSKVITDFAKIVAA